MTTIKLNNQEFEFKFRFRQVKELLKITGKDLSTMDDIAQDFSNIPLIASLGTGKTIEEMELLLDQEETFEGVKSIAAAFGQEVKAYFTPNSQSQTN